jgi:hypothetical protein
MRPRTFAVVAGSALAALALSSALVAANSAGGRKVTIKTSAEGQSVATGKFTLAGTSTADSDSGTLRYALPLGRFGKTAEGLIYTREQWTETLKGKRGTLVIHVGGRRYPVVQDDEAAFLGTWSIVRGTAKYAGWKGGGGVVGVNLTATRIIGVTLSYRYEGTVPG